MVRHEPPNSVQRFAQSSGAAGPVRTCIGCRERASASDLLRVVGRKWDTVDDETVAVDCVVLPDPRNRLPGRGAWLHPVSSCLALAVRRRAFGRALRVSGHLDISAVQRFLEPITTEHELDLDKNRHEHS